MESLETDPKPGNRWFGSPMKMASTPDDSQGAQPTQFSLCEYSIGDTLKRYRSRDNRGGRFSGKSKSKSRQDKHQQFDHDEAQEELIDKAQQAVESRSNKKKTTAYDTYKKERSGEITF